MRTTGPLERYRALVADGFLPMDFHAHNEDTFTGTIASATCGKISLHRITASPHTVTRARKHITHHDPRCIKISIQLAGTSTIEQHGHRTTATPGSITAYDTSAAYEVTFGDDCDIAVLHVERAHLQVEEDSLQACLARTTCAPHTQPAAALVTSLAHNVGLIAHPAGQHYATTMLAMMGPVLTATAADTGVVVRDEKTLLRTRIEHHIDTHLGDPDLSPRSIAAAHYISVRHLHSIFHDRGTTVGQLIKEKRLRAALHMLRDPALAHLSIGTISSRVGITSPAHFSRSFKARYGYTPRAARHPATN